MEGSAREGVSVEALPALPSAGGQVEALGVVGDREATFVAFVAGIGLRYLEFGDSDTPPRWSTAGGVSGSVAGQHGLYYHHDGRGPTAFVSFVEPPGQSWLCLRVPAVGEAMSVDQAARVERSSLSCKVASGCLPSKNADEAALVLANGIVRFMDLTSGKAVGKGHKLEAEAGGQGGVLPAIAGLASRRVAVVWKAEFFVLELDGNPKKIALVSQGVLTFPGLGSLGSFVGLSTVDTAGEEQRLLLCWESSDPHKKGSTTFATASLDSPNVSAVCLPSSSSTTWACASGYLMECLPSAKGKADPTLTLRDARFGVQLASVDLIASGKGTIGGARGLFVATHGAAVVVCGQGASLAAFRWKFSKFSLQTLVGASDKEALAEGPPELSVVRDVIVGKRVRDEATVQEIFQGKRRKTVDELMASEVRSRSWPPSHEMLDLVERGKCWATARALLALPELGEDLAVRLLAADAADEASLLTDVVSRASTPGLLQAALANHLPPAKISSVLEVLLEWLTAYKTFPLETLREAVPGLPTQAQIIRFLSALADGCLPSLLRLDLDLLERVVEFLGNTMKDQDHVEELHAFTRAAMKRADVPFRARQEVPAMEVVLLPF